MDQKISHQQITRRRNKAIVKYSIWSGAVLSLLIALVVMMRSGVSRESLKISTAEVTDLNISVSAVGKVVPIYEEIITSPVSSKILSVYKKAGDYLDKNDPIIALDLLAFNTNLEQKRDELEMKRRKLDQHKISGESQIAELAMQVKIDEMKLQRMEVLLRNERFLDSIGGSTADKIRQGDLDYQVQTLLLEQLKLKYTNQKKIIETETRTLELDYQIAQKNSMLLQKKMNEAQVLSPREGTLTWVNDQIGSSVGEGAQLAVVSDLNNFKIEGNISDSYSDKILPGNKVQVKVGNTVLTGKVGNVIPAVSNGVIKFIVMPDNSTDSQLRIGLKVDLYVVNSMREGALCIDNGSYYMGSGDYEMWVVQDRNLIKRKLTLGQSSYDKVEVLSGLSEGEQVAVCDMNRYSDKGKLKIK